MTRDRVAMALVQTIERTSAAEYEPRMLNVLK